MADTSRRKSLATESLPKVVVESIEESVSDGIPVLPKVHLPLKTLPPGGVPVEATSGTLQKEAVATPAKLSTPWAKRAWSSLLGHASQHELEHMPLHPSRSFLEPLVDVVCQSCFGFRKREFIPPLPLHWVEVKLESGKMCFRNETTKEAVDFPPWGTPAVSSTVFHHHGTTQFVCNCSPNARASLKKKKKNNRSRHLSIETPNWHH